MQKRKIIVRRTPYNRLSFPVLLNAWEQQKLDRHFDIIVRDEPLTHSPGQPLTTGDVVLFSFMTPHLPLIHDEIKVVHGAGALAAGGGPHVTGEQEPARRIGLDVLFIGPGETTFPAFAAHLLNDTVRTGDTYRAPSPAPPEDFNGSLPLSRYLSEIPPLEIMRGCTWNCSYCSTGGGQPVYRDLDSIRHYLDEITRRNCKRINYVCPSSMEYGAAKGGRLNPAKIEALLQLTSRYDFDHIEYGIFPSEIRPDSVTDEGMRILKDYVSHKAITLGAQSGSDERLKQLRRGHTTADIENAVDIANHRGFLVYLDFIIAYPGETPEERSLTFEFIQTLNKKYRIRTQLHHFFPISGSPDAFRFPASLKAGERKTLEALKQSGLTRDGWVENEKQVIAYFQWLKEHFPEYYEKYEG